MFDPNATMRIMFETSAKQFRAFRDINGLKGLASGLLGKTPLDPLDKSLIALCYDLIEVGVFLYLVCFVRLFFLRMFSPMVVFERKLRKHPRKLIQRQTLQMVFMSTSREEMVNLGTLCFTPAN